jgi:hypothetical protein
MILVAATSVLTSGWEAVSGFRRARQHGSLETEYAR